MKGIINRYINCQFWGAGRFHSAYFAVFWPAHANNNLKL